MSIASGVGLGGCTALNPEFELTEDAQQLSQNNEDDQDGEGEAAEGSSGDPQPSSDNSPQRESDGTGGASEDEPDGGVDDGPGGSTTGSEVMDDGDTAAPDASALLGVWYYCEFQDADGVTDGCAMLDDDGFVFRDDGTVAWAFNYHAGDVGCDPTGSDSHESCFPYDQPQSDYAPEEFGTYTFDDMAMTITLESLWNCSTTLTMEEYGPIVRLVPENGEDCDLFNPELINIGDMAAGPFVRYYSE